MLQNQINDHRLLRQGKIKDSFNWAYYHSDDIEPSQRIPEVGEFGALRTTRYILSLLFSQNYQVIPNLRGCSSEQKYISLYGKANKLKNLKITLLLNIFALVGEHKSLKRNTDSVCQPSH